MWWISNPRCCSTCLEKWNGCANRKWLIVGGLAQRVFLGNFRMTGWAKNICFGQLIPCNFPSRIKNKEFGLHQTGIFQPIWVNNVIILVLDHSTENTAFNRAHLEVHRHSLTKNTSVYLLNTQWVTQAFTLLHQSWYWWLYTATWQPCDSLS